MLKKGIHIATNTMAKGQNGSGSAGIFVIPKIDVTGHGLVGVQKAG
jgi:predicted RecA/RadA family phage recombinase